MHSKRNHITVFEHEIIRFDKGEKRISENQFKALLTYYGEGTPYYNIVYNGIQFNHHVGVIQVGDTLIEVLPKSDKCPDSEIEQNRWRGILVDMMKAVGNFNFKITGSSLLKIKPNTILDIYIEMFVNEVEYLLHNGLVKKYHKIEGNSLALKGSLKFGKHIQKNLAHKERFYVEYTKYDVNHQFNNIIYTAIKLISQINTNVSLYSRIGALKLLFPEMSVVKVTEYTFNKLVFDRKTEHYRKPIKIARLLLLKYHPDITRGRNNVLALMFDMNKLWEQFVFVSIKKFKTSKIVIESKTSKNFWRQNDCIRSKIIPDIIINNGKDDCMVLDTKWKNINGNTPSSSDLKQMYVYQDYFNAKKVALVYPGNKNSVLSGIFLNPFTGRDTERECSLIQLEVPSLYNRQNGDIYKWQEEIRREISDKLKILL